MYTIKKLLLTGAATLFLIACETVKIPTKEKDTPPAITITVHNETSGTQTEYRANETISVRRGTRLKFITIARNQTGGVQDLYFSTFNQLTGIKAHVSGGAPNSSGEVPVQLSIATHNNAAIRETYTDVGIDYFATAEATNYNLGVTTVVLKIVVLPDPPALTINTFKVEPGVGVYPGENFTVSWNYSKNTNSPVDLVLAKKYYQEPEVPVYQSLDAPLSGTATLPSGKSGFADFYFTIRYRDNPGVSATSSKLNRQVQPTPGNEPTAAHLVVVGPTTTPSILYEKLPFKISYTFANAGNKELESFEVNLLIDGIKEGETKTVQKLQPLQSVPVEWNVSRELTGFAHSFNVVNSSTSALLNYAQLTFSSK